MDMNLTVPAAYLIFFVVLFVAGLLGCFMRSCCFWLEKDEKEKVASSSTSEIASNITIVVDPSKPDHCLLPQYRSGKHVLEGCSLPGPAPVHSSDSRISKSEPGLVDISIPKVTSALQRRSKIRRTGVYDKLHRNKFSNTI